ncbi:MAG: HAD family hydrolase, partial [Bdellovibrionales bacterium]
RDIDHVVQITNRMLVEENLPPTTLENYRAVFGFPVIEYYKRLGLNVTPERFLQLCETFNDQFVEGLHACTLWPGAEQLLGEIKKSGKTQSVLSASEQNILNLQVKLYAVEHHFDHVQGIADKAAGSKIDRGHQLMKKAGIPAKDTIMIGDTDHDLEVGNALGIDVILVEHGHQHGERLREIHHTVLKLF